MISKTSCKRNQSGAAANCVVISAEEREASGAISTLRSVLGETLAKTPRSELLALHKINNDLNLKLIGLEEERLKSKLQCEFYKEEFQETRAELQAIKAEKIDVLLDPLKERIIRLENDKYILSTSNAHAQLKPLVSFDEWTTRNIQLMSENNRLEADFNSSKIRTDKFMQAYQSTLELNAQLVAENTTLSTQVQEFKRQTNELKADRELQRCLVKRLQTVLGIIDCKDDSKAGSIGPLQAAVQAAFATENFSSGLNMVRKAKTWKSFAEMTNSNLTATSEAPASSNGDHYFISAGVATSPLPKQPNVLHLLHHIPFHSEQIHRHLLCLGLLLHSRLVLPPHQNHLRSRVQRDRHRHLHFHHYTHLRPRLQIDRHRHLHFVLVLPLHRNHLRPRVQIDRHHHLHFHHYNHLRPRLQIDRHRHLHFVLVLPLHQTHLLLNPLQKLSPHAAQNLQKLVPHQ